MLKLYGRGPNATYIRYEGRPLANADGYAGYAAQLNGNEKVHVLIDAKVNRGLPLQRCYSLESQDDYTSLQTLLADEQYYVMAWLAK